MRLSFILLVMLAGELCAQQELFAFATVYSSSNRAADANAFRAYSCKVATFPFQNNLFYLRSKTEATSAQYTLIGSEDGEVWQTEQPGTSDEAAMWFESQIQETISEIAQIDFYFTLRPQVDVSYKLFLLKSGSDWMQDESWVQIGGSQFAQAGEELRMVRKITSNISDYIDPATKNLTFLIYQNSPSAMKVYLDYAQLEVQSEISCDATGVISYLPADLNNDCYVNFKDFGSLASAWLLQSAEGGDIDGNNQLNMSDVAAFSNNWLQCSDPVNADCDAYWSPRKTGIWYEPWYTNEGNYTWVAGHGTGSSYQYLADVNGDGKADAIAYWPSWQGGACYGALSTGKDFGPGTLWTTNFSHNKTFLADVDGDKKADLVGYDNGTWSVELSTGTGFGASQGWASAAGTGSDWQFVADVTGDGKADAVAFYKSSGQWYVAQSTGTSFNNYSLWMSGFGSGSSRQFLADVTGDGKADAVTFTNSAGQWYSAPSTGTAFGTASLWVSGYGTGSVSQMLGDVDGDGKADGVVYFRTNSGEWYKALSNGSSFGSAVSWKISHGEGTRKLPEVSSWRGLGDVFGNGLAAPCVYYANQGAWNVMPADKYYQSAEINLWQAWAVRYVPRALGQFRQYDCKDANVIDEQLEMLADANIDFILFDMTNSIDVGFIKERGQKICERIANWNRSPEHKKIYYAIAVGLTQITNDPNTLEYEAGVVWNQFINNPNCSPQNYFNVGGKPLLVAYGAARDCWENWTGNKTQTRRFTVRWGEGMVYDSYVIINNVRRTLTASDIGLYYGWAYINGSLPTSTGAMVVMPGWNNHVYSTTAPRVYNGVAGDFYRLLCWERVLESKPDITVIVSYNDYTEDTAVAPTDTSNLGMTGEPWYNTSGQLDADFYWNMTKYYNTLFKTSY